MANADTLPVMELFTGKARRAVVAWVVTEADPDATYRTGDLMEATGYSREALRTELYADGGDGPLVVFGILDVEGYGEQSIPTISVAESPVVQFLREYHGEGTSPTSHSASRSDDHHTSDDHTPPLWALFETRGPRRLAGFFLTQADPEQSYSYNTIADQGRPSLSACRTHMDTLIDAGLVRTVEGVRSTEYTVNPDSDLTDALVELNELVYATYRERAAEPA